MRRTLKLNSCWDLANGPAVREARNKRMEENGSGFMVTASTFVCAASSYYHAIPFAEQPTQGGAEKCQRIGLTWQPGSAKEGMMEMKGRTHPQTHALR